MATTKTLTPTNQQITIAAFSGEKPDQRQIADAETKMADAINLIDPKKNSVSSLSSDTEILTWNPGAYMIALNANSSYIPSRYGTLVIAHGSGNYGVATFTSTTGNFYYRHMNGTNGWHTDWTQAIKNSQLETRAKAARQAWGTTMTAENFGLGLLLINHTAAYTVWFSGTEGINVRSLRTSDGAKTANGSMTIGPDDVDGTTYTITRNGTTMQVTTSANATITVLYT